MEFIFPEIQILKCIKEYGFLRKKKIVREGKIYISSKDDINKDSSDSNTKRYVSYAMAYVYLFFFSLISLVILLAPIYFIFDINKFIIKGTVNNTCLTMLYVFGIFSGAAMIIPAFRKIYDLVPWMYFFVKVIFFDLIVMGVSLNGLFIINNLVLGFLIMMVVFILLRTIMCIYINRYNYTYDRYFKTFGSLSFAIGFLGIIFL
ncbi:hypothetical protein SAMN04487886_104322 [Clostridium sp. DSM 8431]|uniref:hypothetical protein n=1 Tax=Clostridium sp. DSM 8431 TaxID=1761781 RepID=UPI0008E98813|nr:hypothetical protein [Clostridium sp. DSM 8431]SFU50787.1 hypothetical protein SAMN04487886_104322 [Clostridium sp. DSM 8431]